MDSDIPLEYLMHADEAFNSGDLSKARDICIQSIKRFPESPALYSLLIQVYLKETNIFEAEKILELAISKFPINRSFQLLKTDLEKKKEYIKESTLSVDTSKEVDFNSPPKSPLSHRNKLALTTYPFLGRTVKIPINPNNFPFHTLNITEFEPIRNLGLRTSLLRLL